MCNTGKYSKAAEAALTGDIANEAYDKADEAEHRNM